MTNIWKAAVLAASIAAAAAPAQSATVLKSYNLEAYRNDTLVMSGSFSVNVEADTQTVSVSRQQATLASADLTLGSTHFTLANTGLFRNSSPRSYNDADLYQLYGAVGTGLSFGTGVAGNLEDFSVWFNPYSGAVSNSLLFSLGSGSLSATRTVLTEALPPAVPEPATWALMIAGFGLTGAALRARRRSVALA